MEAIQGLTGGGSQVDGAEELLASVSVLQRQARQAEAAQISRMLSYEDAREREIVGLQLPAPARLRDAITFRDGTCRAPGCMVPAERSDLDHQIPWPAGPTQAANLWALCRRHHRMKSHGFLDPPLSMEEEEMAADSGPVPFQLGLIAAS